MALTDLLDASVKRPVLQNCNVAYSFNKGLRKKRKV